jgi:HTH-type transcriptional regulator / antitoxin HigA
MRTLKPIRSNADHARALREIDKLIAKAPKKASVAFDQLEALTILVEAYERSHPDHRIDESFDPVEAIRFHLDRLGKTPKDLEKILKCGRSRAWEILQRKRALTLPQIRALVRELGIPAERLIAEYKIRAA